MPSESLNYHYERNPLDPRIQHEITLETDHYGTPLKKVAIGYPRRKPEYPEQGKLIMTYEESVVIHRDDLTDSYRLAVPVEGKAYELSGISFNNRPFEKSGLIEILSATEEIPFEEEPTISRIQKRLILHQQSTYYSNDLSKELPLGEVAFHALPYRAYEKEFTPGLIEKIFNGRVTDDIMTKKVNAKPFGTAMEPKPITTTTR